MLFLLEIGLTILLCYKYSQAKMQWALGLIPMAIAIVIGIVLGIFLGVLGVDQSTLVCSGVSVDLILVVYLIWKSVTLKPQA